MIDNANAERRVLDGEVDFTMMYAAHDAFSRHLDRIAASIEPGAGAVAAVAPRWELFTRQLHIHHTVEDASLWPRLRLAISEPDEVAVLDAMEHEHAQIDPLLERVDAAVAGGDASDLLTSLRELRAGLGAHMRHEENDALPLVETYLGLAGWAAFAQDIRKTQGLRGGALYFPWLLEGVPAPAAAKLLGVLPAPVRLLYRRLWVPKYLRAYS